MKQRQMYEEKIERMKYEMSPAFRPERTISLGSFSSSGISSSRLSFNDELDTLENERSLEKLKEEVVQANSLVRYEISSVLSIYPSIRWGMSNRISREH